MKQVNKKYGAVDFSGWELESINAFAESAKETIAKAVTEAVSIALENEDGNYRCGLSFPVVYGPDSDGRSAPAVKDPLDMYLELPFGDVDSGPEYMINLREMLIDDMNNWDDVEFTEDNGRLSKQYGLLRDALICLASKIDERLQAIGQQETY
jgi:hypothetical protein